MALTTSILTGGTNSHQTTSEEANYHATDFYSAGVVGTLGNTGGVAPTTGNFNVNAQGTPDMTVAVAAGVCYVTATPASGNSQRLRVKNSASANVTIAANATGGTRYDWLYVKIDATAAANPAADASDVASLVTSRSTSATTDNGTAPTYGTLLAVITVANGASSITNGNIADRRQQALPTNAQTGWYAANETWTYSSYDSTNKTGVITVPTDATTKYSAGMRIAIYQTTQQYGIITKVAATALTVYFGTDYSLSNATIYNPQYSVQKAPFGFPLDPTKWTVKVTDTATRLTSVSAGGTVVNPGSLSITVPIGAWNLGYEFTLGQSNGGAAIFSPYGGLSTANNSFSDNELVSDSINRFSGTSSCYFPVKRTKLITVATATTYYLVVSAQVVSTTTVGPDGARETTAMQAVCAFL